MPEVTRTYDVACRLTVPFFVRKTVTLDVPEDESPDDPYYDWVTCAHDDISDEDVVAAFRATTVPDDLIIHNAFCEEEMSRRVYLEGPPPEEDPRNSAPIEPRRSPPQTIADLCPPDASVDEGV